MGMWRLLPVYRARATVYDCSTERFLTWHGSCGSTQSAPAAPLLSCNDKNPSSPVPRGIPTPFIQDTAEAHVA